MGRRGVVGAGSAGLPARLTRSAGQPLGVGDQDALALQANPAAVGEIGERLVDRLTRRADQLRDLPLLQVRSHTKRPPLTPACRTAAPVAAAAWRLGRARR